MVKVKRLQFSARNCKKNRRRRINRFDSSPSTWVFSFHLVIHFSFFNVCARTMKRLLTLESWNFISCPKFVGNIIMNVLYTYPSQIPYIYKYINRTIARTSFYLFLSTKEKKERKTKKNERNWRNIFLLRTRICCFAVCGNYKHLWALAMNKNDMTVALWQEKGQTK